jgi:hypothetical protein
VTQLVRDQPAKSRKRVKEATETSPAQDFNPCRSNAKPPKVKLDSSSKQHSLRRTTNKKNKTTEEKPSCTKIIIKSRLEGIAPPRSPTNPPASPPEPPKPSTCSNPGSKPKIPIPEFRPVIQTNHNYFHINGPGQEILNSFCFNFTNFANTFCTLPQSKSNSLDYQFLFADIHTVISESFLIKGLQVIPLDAEGRSIQFRCNVVKKGVKVLRNVESLYASHPKECFLHLKRKLVQICLLKKFIANFFEKVTSV